MAKRAMTERAIPALLLSAGLLTAIFGGCGEEDVPVIIDADEIIRYVNEVDIAQELFRVDAITDAGPYTLPSSNGTFYDTVVDHERLTEVFMVPLKIPDTSPGANRGDSVPNDPDLVYVDHGTLGELREALARVTDNYTLQVTGVYPGSTIVDTTEFELVRYGFFLKAGGDNKPYVGWLLWGYNGSGDVSSPVSLRVESSGGAEFITGLLYDEIPLSAIQWIPEVPYIRLNVMDTMRAGERIHLTATKAGGTLPTTQMVSDFDTGGYFMRPMVRFDNVDYIDSLSYLTPSSRPLFYNLITVQMVSEQSPLVRRALCVPYRR